MDRKHAGATGDRARTAESDPGPQGIVSGTTPHRSAATSPEMSDADLATWNSLMHSSEEAADGQAAVLDGWMQKTFQHGWPGQLSMSQKDDLKKWLEMQESIAARTTPPRSATTAPRTPVGAGDKGVPQRCFPGQSSQGPGPFYAGPKHGLVASDPYFGTDDTWTTDYDSTRPCCCGWTGLSRHQQSPQNQLWDCWEDSAKDAAIASRAMPARTTPPRKPTADIHQEKGDELAKKTVFQNLAPQNVIIEDDDLDTDMEPVGQRVP